MNSKDFIYSEGIVKEVLPSQKFLVVLDNEMEIIAHVAGKMRKSFIRILPGDRVKIEMSPYDFSQARIIRRLVT